MAGDRSHTFDECVRREMPRLAAAEQRVAQFFMEHKQAVLLESAAEIAMRADASDATVVRTAQSLGFNGLGKLREAMLADLTIALSPDRRMRKTLSAAGNSAAQALNHVVSLHGEALKVISRPEFAEKFSDAVTILASADRRHVFGIGPSGALASYVRLQFNRIGFETHELSAAGIGLADQLLRVQPGDAVLMMAYAPLYREVAVVLEDCEHLGVPVVLVSDTLGPLVRAQVAQILPVPRGRVDHLSTHAGTMVMIEALITALAARRKDKALDELDRLSTLRGKLDKSWLRRGTRKPTPRKTKRQI